MLSLLLPRLAVKMAFDNNKDLGGISFYCYQHTYSTPHNYILRHAPFEFKGPKKLPVFNAFFSTLEIYFLCHCASCFFLSISYLQRINLRSLGHIFSLYISDLNEVMNEDSPLSTGVKDLYFCPFLLVLF